jgi:hypothetical protein
MPTSNNVSPVLVQPPPSDIKVPAPPAGFVPTNKSDYRGFTPRRAELAALPDAVRELRHFDDFDQVFGKTAPPAEHVAQAFDAAAQWSTLRLASEAWDDYARTQEGLAWVDTRALLERMKKPFELASTYDPSLLSKFPSLARLFGVGRAIAHRANATTARKAKKSREEEAEAKAKAKAGASATSVPAPAPAAVTPAATPTP